MVNEELYVELCKAAQRETISERIANAKRLMRIYDLDYRTVIALMKIVNNETHVSKDMLEKLLDKDFYTYENMLLCCKNGLDDIIPIKFYENEKFIKEANIKSIPNGFAYGYDELEFFTCSTNIEKIGDYAFTGCNHLLLVNLAYTVTYIGQYAFKDCVSLRVEDLPDNITYIGEGAFENCQQITSIYIPIKLSKVEDYVFKDCVSLEEVFFTNALRTGTGSFKNCTSLKNLNNPIGEVGIESFANCTSLTQIDISTSTIKDRAFMGCTNLENIYFSESCPKQIRPDAFVGCNNLTKIMVDGFPYHVREIDGFKELSKHIRYSKDENNNILSSCDIDTKETVKEALSL